MAESTSPRVDPLRLAVVHYHLRPGGVTTVIAHTLAALKKMDRPVDVVILSGESVEDFSSGNAAVVPELAYDGTASAEELSAILEKAAMNGLGQKPDVWHVHNHSLGKNASFPDAIAQLVHRGHRFLLQAHDFAEDGRPANFSVLERAQTPYPSAKAVHYGVLNARDRFYLQEAGVPEDRVHLLPNPVPPHHVAPPAKTPGRALMLYSTRGIRRKNLGEMILLAGLCQGRAFFATTRGPDNPRWQAIHDDWVTFAEERQLPVAFGVVDRSSPVDFKISEESEKTFDAWLGAADAMLTTSVAEGFGMAYLESIRFERPLLGRDLPEITHDFKENGLQFPGLYRHVRVPIEWVNEERLLEEIRKAIETYYQTYHQPLPQDGAELALESMVDHRGRVDFGRLPEGFQREVIDHVIAEEPWSEVVFETEAAVADAELWFDGWFGQGMTVPVERQRNLLEKHYSAEAFGRRLMDVYETLASEPEAPETKNLQSDTGHKLLTAFLSPERFQFLRSS